MIPLGVPALPGLETFDQGHYDSDDGVISVPNTGVYTTVKALVLGNTPFWLSATVVSVFDAAALNVLTWQLVVNGVVVPPWKDQRMQPGQSFSAITIGRLFLPNNKIEIQASNPVTAQGAFDVTGRIIGDVLRSTTKGAV